MVFNSSNYLSAIADGGSGTDTLKITGLASSTVINLSSLAANVTNTEAMDVADGSSEFIKISASAIQSIVGQGTSSTFSLVLDSNDSIVIESGSYYTTNASGSVYTFYNSDPTLGGATQIAQLNVSTA